MNEWCVRGFFINPRTSALLYPRGMLYREPLSGEVSYNKSVLLFEKVYLNISG